MACQPCFERAKEDAANHRATPVPDVISHVVLISYKSTLHAPLDALNSVPLYGTSSPHNSHAMGKKRRQSALAKSIQSGLLRDPDRFKKTAWGQVIAFFTFRRIKLIRHERHLFAKLRQEVWNFDEDEYQSSFHTTSGQPPLKMIGDLGYSGSVNLVADINSRIMLIPP